MPQDELEGMPPPVRQRKLSFLGASTEGDREFVGREQVRFEIHGYVSQVGTEFLEDEANPEREFVKIQVTSIKEI